MLIRVLKLDFGSKLTARLHVALLLGGLAEDSLTCLCVTAVTDVLLVAAHI
jgi:hypothetical protein